MMLVFHRVHLLIFGFFLFATIIHQSRTASNSAISKDVQQLFAKQLMQNLGQELSSNGLDNPKADANFDPAQVLLQAISGKGDRNLFIELIRRTPGIHSIIDVGSDFITSKLSSINCLPFFNPDDEKDVMPRFLLFNEFHENAAFVFNGTEPSGSECLASHFDPSRTTIVLVHGFLGSYGSVDGLINIKDHLIDLNRNYLKDEALRRDATIRRDASYNIIYLDWQKAANPTPRSNYIRSAVNSRVVGHLLARFLINLTRNCKVAWQRVHIVSHSLGTHLTGFASKRIQKETGGSKPGRIVYLDPVSLCFGKLFAKPEYRLRADDATETMAVQMASNVFSNPMDAAQVNFMVNGGMNQPGCTDDLRNTTYSTLELGLDEFSKFAPCSHMRALALFEDNLQLDPNGCQMVGYRCDSYDRFLAGECADCDKDNCKLMDLDKNPADVSSSSQTTRSLSSVKPNQDGPKYYFGTSNLAPYCVHYYQFTLYIDGSQVRQNLQPPARSDNKLHITVRLVAQNGNHFKGFTLIEDVIKSHDWNSESTLRFRMLLNSSAAGNEPVKVVKAYLTNQHGQIVRAKLLQLRYMSNISARIRDRYSTFMCPSDVDTSNRIVSYDESACTSQQPKEALYSGPPTPVAPAAPTGLNGRQQTSNDFNGDLHRRLGPNLSGELDATDRA